MVCQHPSFFSRLSNTAFGWPARLAGPLLASALLLTTVSPGAAAAQTAPQNKVAIDSNSVFAFDIFLSLVNVGFQFQCFGGAGSISVTLQQTSQTPNGTVAGTGGGGLDVPCDGQQRIAAVTVAGSGLNLGNAFAQATLISPTGTATDARTVTIVLR